MYSYLKRLVLRLEILSLSNWFTEQQVGRRLTAHGISLSWSLSWHLRVELRELRGRTAACRHSKVAILRVLGYLVAWVAIVGGSNWLVELRGWRVGVALLWIWHHWVKSIVGH